MHKTTIKGKKKKGKNILILAGVHGNELTPVYCANLIATSNIDELKKSFKKLTILNAVNLEGIKNNTRDIPDDSTNDLNRSFKKDDNKNIIDQLKEYIDSHDVIIDLHSSPSCSEFVLLNQDEYTNSYADFCEKYGINYLIRYSANDTIKKYGLEKGKISFTFEMNKMDNVSIISASRAFTSIGQIIKNINKFEVSKSEPYYETYREFYTHHEGIFFPNKETGDVISHGQSLGKILLLDTFEEKNITYMGVDGVIITLSNYSFISADIPICYVQPTN